MQLHCPHLNPATEFTMQPTVTAYFTAVTFFTHQYVNYILSGAVLLCSPGTPFKCFTHGSNNRMDTLE